MTAALTTMAETEAWLRARLADGELHDMHQVKREARAARVSVGRLAAIACRICERVPGAGRGGWWRLLPPELVAPPTPAKGTPWRKFQPSFFGKRGA